ncbi:hypothetical protein [Propionicicella superfundia]|uniref:hypothetical protein n=1 Tax=Propionicicella superfundia TaxID=348582 RepID=UPI0004218A1C|nr:hypothetical protein [Propionicicella superfundia]
MRTSPRGSEGPVRPLAGSRARLLLPIVSAVRAARRHSTRSLFAAVLGVFVAGSVVLGAGTARSTSSVWSDDVWIGARVTTVAGAATAAGGLSPGAGTVFPDGTPAWTLNKVRQACVRVGVTTTSDTPIVWSVRLDTSAQPWNGATSGYNLDYGYAFSGGLTGGRYLTIVGRSDSSPATSTVMAGQTRTFDLCNWSAGTPPIGDATWATVSVSKATTVDPGKVCKTITATSLERTPFWFAWTATVATADMFAAMGTRNSYWWEYSDWNVVRAPTTPSTDPAQPSTVTFTSATNDTTSLLADGKSYVYTLCLRGS